MFRSEMKDGDRLVVNTRTMKFKYQITEANNSPKKEVTGKAVFCSEEPANSNEIEYLNSLVKIQVLKPRDKLFIDTMLATSTRDLIYFLDKAYPCKDELLDNGNSGQQTLLTIASQREEWALCFKLLEQGATPDAGHHGNSMTPLHMAAKAGQSDLLEALLLHNANPNMTTGPWSYKGECKRMTPLRFTLLYEGKDVKEIAKVRKSMIQTLLESGADPMTIDTTEIAEFVEPLELMLETLLVESTNSIKHTKIQQTYLKYLRKVIKDHSDLQAKTESGCTPEEIESAQNLMSLLDKLISKSETMPKLQNSCRAIIRSELSFPVRRSIKDLDLPREVKKFICDRGGI
ncbi:ankyrin repeat domain-containing protein [Endozoicomonas sp. YOMI1]|uniref:ankyrin repeat domain-containing protein n=1 Tax=Endozoicomonas sp. YOMI1 TaxID=2828739 RepID=UPI002147D9FA|nr:ankyrin repeat domain-containing protein [Endozoicomonas sp. YOMI1]